MGSWGAQLYNATIPETDEVTISCTYRVLVQRHDHLLYLDIPRSTKDTFTNDGHCGSRAVRQRHNDEEVSRVRSSSGVRADAPACSSVVTQLSTHTDCRSPNAGMSGCRDPSRPTEWVGWLATSGVTGCTIVTWLCVAVAWSRDLLWGSETVGGLDHYVHGLGEQVRLIVG